MNQSFNTKLQTWLNDDNRTIEDGCLLLLQLENNQIHYQNLLRHSNRKAVMDYLVSELNKRLTVRLANITHEQVAAMEAQVAVIEQEHYSFQENNPAEDFRKGKRDDHESLPEEIQARYVENLSLLQRMREVHLQLRHLSKENVSCPDSERYPFLKELIELDKQLHENWEVYDHYVLDTAQTSTSVSSSEGGQVLGVLAETSSSENPPAKKSTAKRSTKKTATP